MTSPQTLFNGFVDAASPRVAIGPDGQGIALFLLLYATGADPDVRLYGVRRASNGVLGIPARITSPDQNAGSFDVALGASGTAVAVWRNARTVYVAGDP